MVLVVYFSLAKDRIQRMNDHEHLMQRAIELAANIPEFPFWGIDHGSVSWRDFG
jgi:hypothetical protein